MEPLLGIKSFFPISTPIYRSNSKGSVLPSGIIIGRFQHLTCLHHENLARYYDIIKEKHERIFIVSETYRTSLKDLIIDETTKLKEEDVRKIFYQILDALIYLEERNIYHRNLSIDNIYVVDNMNMKIKLTEYGMNYITKSGNLVSFPIGNPRYMAPEVISEGVSYYEKLDIIKSDLWSAGIIALELALKKNIIEGEDPFEQFLNILSFIGHEIDKENELMKAREMDDNDIQLLKSKTFEKRNIKLLNYQKRFELHKKLKSNSLPLLNSILEQINFSDTFKEIIRSCLDADPVTRISPNELIEHPYFQDLYESKKSKTLWMVSPIVWGVLLDREDGDKWKEALIKKEEKEIRKQDGLTAQLYSKTSKRNVFDDKDDITLEELYFIWKNISKNIEELAPEFKISPPILRIPLFVYSGSYDVEDIEMILHKHGSKDQSRLYTNTTVKIDYQSLLEIIHKKTELQRQSMVNTNTKNWTSEQKEKDFDYQKMRIRIFKKLLPELPESKYLITKEAQKDIPPLLRNKIWAAILDVPHPSECKKIYDRIDKTSPGPADKQIDLDIPRCHQYHELLSSEEGHKKFKRILKAWVKYNPKLGYWQGIDSLLAPFLCLHFNDEHIAFMCLQKIIEKFSKNLFDRDNTEFLQEHLHILKQLLSYHDPELSMHLHRIGFHPNLYAIPWFITLFTHLFSMDQIFRLWDKLLISTSQLPFFVAYAMLKKIRDILLPLDFNACILLFSSLPSINIEEIIEDANEVSRTTPISVTMPKYLNYDDV